MTVEVCTTAGWYLPANVKSKTAWCLSRCEVRTQITFHYHRLPFHTYLYLGPRPWSYR
ncbi:hypothetical protein VFPFJ_06915 [Purpureocillium lilacinum]|uniref:Uncharacterized protein n=1 Tax=Purpureocillium lilacinum TaxID=33203 RepID=A0A179HFZ3_PURLI|nr:hypothetical protein VFPFJ_06915 [Purpureocillium lilacinum]OAQ80145.1 hypothetical protein VFPBJ_05730 [Purpureocillium lilacinum]OAQ88450.1 hypothetical protein VFPFJ_06915 [Purpureocillium lilacinum]